MIAVQFTPKRDIAEMRCCSLPSPSLLQIRNAPCRYDHRRAESFRGNIAHSYTYEWRRRPWMIDVQLASKGGITPEHPILPQQQMVLSNSASYVLSVSCLFLCGPLRRISVNARFYVQCCLVLWRGDCYGGPLQFPDEIQGQSTECPEKVDAFDWIPLLCIQTWCLWWFVDGTSVACLFDLRVCYVYVLCYVRFAEKVTEVAKNVRNEIQVSLRKRTLDICNIRPKLQKKKTLQWCLLGAAMLYKRTLRSMQ